MPHGSSKMSYVGSHLARRLRQHHEALLLAIATVLLFHFYTSGIADNPPGFHMDESSIAYNAYLIARTGSSESGISWPLYFQFYTGRFTQYGNPTYVYVLAILYLLFPPSIFLARMLSGTLVFMATLLLGFLATRISRQRLIGIIVALTAMLTPWLFEISRLVFEVSFYPLALALFLFFLNRAHKKATWTLRDNVLLAVTLGLLTYCYTSGRLLAPLLALGLLRFSFNKQRLIGVVKTWAAYGITLIPLLVFNLRHPGALTRRFHEVTYVNAQSTLSEILFDFAKRYFEDLSIIRLLLIGDNNPRHHIPNALGSILVPTFVLAVMGATVVIARHWRDPWWSYNLYGLAVSIVPGALTTIPFHTLRLVSYPVFLLVLTIPALMWLNEPDMKPANERAKRHRGKGRQAQWVLSVKGLSSRSRRSILVILLVLTAGQAMNFQRQFREARLTRGYVFDTAYKEVYDAAMAHPTRPIYLIDGYWGPAYIHAFWYATLQGKSTSEFIHLDNRKRPPPGSLVISSEDKCTSCQVIFARQIYMLYRAL
jgi:hypothetical protein